MSHVGSPCNSARSTANAFLRRLYFHRWTRDPNTETQENGVSDGIVASQMYMPYFHVKTCRTSTFYKASNSGSITIYNSSAGVPTVDRRASEACEILAAVPRWRIAPPAASSHVGRKKVYDLFASHLEALTLPFCTEGVGFVFSAYALYCRCQGARKAPFRDCCKEVRPCALLL